MKKIFYSILVVAIMGSTFSCSEEMLDPTLAQDKSVETSINSQEDLQAILYGAYNRLASSVYYGRDFIIYGEVRTDNTFSNGNSGRFIRIGAMNLTESDGYADDTWQQMYAAIANANIIINQDPTTLEGDPAAIKQIQGQALAIRALVHFDLVKLYGQQHVNGGGESALGVPYVTEYKGEDLTPARNTVGEVKEFVYADLNAALALMSEEYNASTCEVITTYAVNALISRVAVYFGDWQIAKDAAQKVIESGKYSIVPASDFASSYAVDCPPNSIFELAVSDTDNPGINGLAYIYRGTSYGDIQVLEDAVEIFGENDVRASDEMIGFYVAPDGTVVENLANLGKYPNMEGFDNIKVIRYEEVILNYAEALFELGETADALIYLNKIPANRNADAYAEITKENILLERRKELLFEGFRFDDLARTGQDIPLVSEFQQTHGGPDYGSYNYAFPIPLRELNANPDIVQNEGY